MEQACLEKLPGNVTAYPWLRTKTQREEIAESA
jgi:hypothetical protein